MKFNSSNILTASVCRSMNINNIRAGLNSLKCWRQIRMFSKLLTLYYGLKQPFIVNLELLQIRLYADQVGTTRSEAERKVILCTISSRFGVLSVRGRVRIGQMPSALSKPKETWLVEAFLRILQRGKNYLDLNDKNRVQIQGFSRQTWRILNQLLSFFIQQHGKNAPHVTFLSSY